MNFEHTAPTLSGKDRFGLYIAEPEGDPIAAIIVIQEIFGVNAGIRQKCDRLAKDGYLAVAPDLFWRLERGVELDPDNADEMQRGFDFFGKFDFDAAVRDLEATIHWIRQERGVAKVGCVGYCAGGRLAYMVAARTDIDASVGYYGVMIDQMLNEKHGISNPLMLHVPTEDGFVDAAAQKAMHAGLDDHPRVTIHDYQGLDHGFATEFGNRRDDAGATLADERTASFFKQHLA